MGGGETSEGGVGTGDVVRVGYFRGEGGRDGEEGEGLEGFEGFDDGVLWVEETNEGRDGNQFLCQISKAERRGATGLTQSAGHPGSI